MDAAKSPGCAGALTMADSAPASMVRVAGQDQMMVPHCPGYGTLIQGDCFRTSVWSVRQYICVVGELLS